MTAVRDEVALAAALGDEAHAIAPGFIDAWLLAALRDRAARLHADGAFRAAAIGADRAVRPEVRGDALCWLAGEDAAERAWLARMETLRRVLNERLYLGLFELECHFARYAPGAGYARHLDRFAADGAAGGERVVSVVLYLNDDWRPADGGELCLELDAGLRRTVPPAAGTLALFLSDRIWHEVRPARRERWSVTGWFRRRAAG